MNGKIENKMTQMRNEEADEDDAVADDDLDVPPLEDMSELIEQAHQLQKLKEKKDPLSHSSSLSASSEGHMLAKQKDEVTGSEEIKQGQSAKKQTQSTEKKSASQTCSAFGGLKKGFLFGSAPKPSSKQQSKTPKQGECKEQSSKGLGAMSGQSPEEIPFIKPQRDGSENGAQRIQEVQDALKANAPLLENKDWISDDLLAKIERHPRLARQLSDPRFSQAMSMFQSNPQAAMQHFQSNPEIQTFFKDFCEILGDHFSKLAPSDTPSPANSSPKASLVQEVKVHNSPGADMTVSSSTDPKQATSSDEAKMREIMGDPEVMKAFGHPQTRLLFEALRTNPELAQRMMHNADAEFKQHIQTLVRKGLLGFAR